MDLMVSMDEVWQFGRPNHPELLPGCGEHGKQCPLLKRAVFDFRQPVPNINRGVTRNRFVNQPMCFFSYFDKLTSSGVCCFFSGNFRARLAADTCV